MDNIVVHNYERCVFFKHVVLVVVSNYSTIANNWIVLDFFTLKTHSFLQLDN